MVSSFHEEDAGAMPLFGHGFRKNPQSMSSRVPIAALNRLDSSKRRVDMRPQFSEKGR
jgi:hypothetical protein